MTFDEAGALWIGDFDGVIGGYEYDDWLNAPLQEQKELYGIYVIRLTSSWLCSYTFVCIILYRLILPFYFSIL